MAQWRSVPENREKHIAYLRAYHEAHKDDPEYRRVRREAKVLHKFGITQAELDVMLEAQNSLCAICGNGHVGVGTRLHIDHCHDTGRIRGLLCGKCNTAVGLLDDSPERAEQLAAYLRR
jgi:hypothetical protein